MARQTMNGSESGRMGNRMGKDLPTSALQARIPWVSHLYAACVLDAA